MTALPTLILVVSQVACAPLLADAGEEPTEVQTEHLFEGKVVVPVVQRYLLALPDGYDDPARKDERWPLLVFLHGVGECGTDLDVVKRHGPPKLIASGKKLPCIVVSPQTEVIGWSPLALHALLDDLEATLRVDRAREYLTGISMGGFGTWATAIERPDRFAAIVPICGGADWIGVRRLGDVPTWVFHGRRDPAVPISFSEQAVTLLQSSGGSPKFTIVEDGLHDVWTRAYDDPALWAWLFAQRRR